METPALSGLALVGRGRGRPGGAVFRGVNPATGEALEPAFHTSHPDEVARAAELAAAAAPRMAALSGSDKSAFLLDLARRLEADAPALAARAQLETALPEARCLGEIGRTVGQLRLFADLVRQGHWVDARIELAQPDRKPLPKPDHRSMCRALGPVAVFCASNFPFAYSVAGGDTASALAAGCPVVVVAHPAHPGTAERVGSHVAEAARAAGLPEGAFSMLVGDGRVVGQALVRHPAIRAVGFTGSRAGGRALMDLAAARPEPIPVYAEMSSVNPVVFLDGALAERGEALAAGMLGSCTLGVGQFCTQPGLLLMARTPAAQAFVARLVDAFRAAPEGVMLHAGIARAYRDGLSARLATKGVGLLARGAGSGQPNRAEPALLEVSAADFLADPSLRHEIFGPCSTVVWCDGAAQLRAALGGVEGSLTGTLHATDAELAANADLVETLSRLAGRVVLNGFPTGVEVSSAIVHGGPYPSLSDGRSTSVGANALYRFTRLVCYQNFPDAALPPELRADNPLGIRRLVGGNPA
jgi:NADP-dependent aldehyde dehydrogenase